MLIKNVRDVLAQLWSWCLENLEDYLALLFYYRSGYLPHTLENNWNNLLADYRFELFQEDLSLLKVDVVHPPVRGEAAVELAPLAD
jgi:hypothetical protein